LKNRLKAFYNYNDNQFYLSVLTARTVTVNFYGEVQTTGGITLSAVNTLFNALVAAGGPTDIGSVRRIRLISGSEDKVFDTYKFMDEPSIADEFYLKNNDYVHIPVAERVVSISGAVRRPFKYELLEDEHLVKLIDFAGGVLNDAYLKDIRITRYNADQRVVVNVNLRDIMDGGGDFLLQPGDEIFIRSIDEEVENVVTINGAVVMDGEYERQEGMRVSQLIDKARLDKYALLDYGYLLRRNPDGRYIYNRFSPAAALENRGGSDDLVLEDLDIIQIPSRVSYSDEVNFTVGGAIRIPGQYDFDPAGVLRVQDAILLSGGLKPGASDFGYILRRNPDEPKRADYIVFNPKVALQDAGSADNHILMPFDSLVVYDEFDLRDNFFIEVYGAVRNPGIFPYDPSLNLQQALDLAGGLTFSAATNRVDVARLIINENQPTRTINITTNVIREHGAGMTDTGMVLLPFDEIFVRDVPEFELQQNVTIQGEVTYPGHVCDLGR
jgi:protein involved in polysaccharide export with SLBB domain